MGDEADSAVTNGRVHLLERAKESASVKIALTAVLSQVFAAAAIASTSLLGLHTSDAYAVGAQVGNGALAGVAISIVYMLAIGRPGFSAWRRWQYIAATYSGCLLIVTMLFGNMTVGGSATQTEHILTICGVGGALLGAAAIEAVRQACLGRPLRLASLTIVPNVFMIVGTVVALVAGTDATLAPAVAWAMGCGVMLVAGSRSRAPRQRVSAQQDPLALHSIALALGAAVQTFLPPLYLSTISSLAPGTATGLALATRIGSGLIGITTNSVLMARSSWSSSHAFPSRLCERLVGVSIALFVLTVAAAPAGVHGATWSIAFLWWFTSLMATPFINREINSRKLARAVFIKGTLDLGVSLLALWQLVAHPSVVGFLAVVVISQAVTGVVGSVALGQRRLAVLYSLLLVSGASGLFMPLA